MRTSDADRRIQPDLCLQAGIMLHHVALHLLPRRAHHVAKSRGSRIKAEMRSRSHRDSMRSGGPCCAAAVLAGHFPLDTASTACFTICAVTFRGCNA